MLNEQNKFARYVLLNSYRSQKQCQQYTMLAFGSSQRLCKSRKSNSVQSQGQKSQTTQSTLRSLHMLWGLAVLSTTNSKKQKHDKE